MDYLLDDITEMEVPIQVFEEVHCNVLELRVGTNCPQGGDTGHGGRTLFALKDLASTDWEIHVTDRQGVTTTVTDLKCFAVVLGGDAEQYTFTTLLKKAVQVLETPPKLHRTTMYFDEEVWEELVRTAQQESQENNVRVTAADLVRQIIRGQREPIGRPGHPGFNGSLDEE